jgi:histidinol dehydrogenase
MKFLRTNQANFREEFRNIVSRNNGETSEVEEVVRSILTKVREGGDEALISLTKKWDRVKLTPGSLEVSRREIEEAQHRVTSQELRSLKLAAKRIESFHRKKLPSSWSTSEEEGITLGQVVQPLERVGLYVPGGKAAYPSTVLMNAIPARVAGVKELIMSTPAIRGEINPYVLVAANLTGINRIFKVGGAQAIGALAYGTETIPRVDKIVGPGNIYVATAKRQIFTKVGIDIIAGPSEILVLSDGSGEPAFIAADLLSQAEHDEQAISILITTSIAFANKVKNNLISQLRELKRREIAEVAIKSNGVIIVARDLTEAVDLVNQFAPEHLELAIKNTRAILKRIRNAGAIFLGNYSPEAVGDYLAGPNHVLPTGGTARFSSPLGVEDFLKRSNVIFFKKKRLQDLSEDIIRIANLEGLDGHAKAVEIRMGVRRKRAV